MHLKHVPSPIRSAGFTGMDLAPSLSMASLRKRLQKHPGDKKGGSSLVEATICFGLLTVLLTGLLSPSINLLNGRTIESSAKLIPVMTIRAVSLFDDGTARVNLAQLPAERARIRNSLSQEGLIGNTCIHSYALRRETTGCIINLESVDPSCPLDSALPLCERLLESTHCSDYVYGCLTTILNNNTIVRILLPELELHPLEGAIDPGTPTVVIPQTTAEPQPSSSPTISPTPAATPVQHSETGAGSDTSEPGGEPTSNLQQGLF